jgi:hypothetical protein
MKTLLLLLLAVSTVFAGADDDWAVIVSMDAGPTRKPASLDEARDFAKVHFARHSALIDKFLKENPGDSRVFEARLRLAAIQAAMGKMEDRQSLVDEAMRLLQVLEKDKSATPAQRAEAGFRRVSLLMQSLKGQESDRRRDLVAAAVWGRGGVGGRRGRQGRAGRTASGGRPPTSHSRRGSRRKSSKRLS